MSMTWDSIGWDNDLSPIRRQTIIWTNTGVLLTWPLHQTCVKYLSKLFYHEIVFENIVSEMAAPLFRGRCDNKKLHWWVQVDWL